MVVNMPIKQRKRNYKMNISIEDYNMLAWENKNFADYLIKVLGYDDDMVSQVANGHLQGEVK